MKQTLHDPRRTPGLAAFALGLPVRPIGYLANGRPVYPIAGGAPDGDDGKGGKDDKPGGDGNDDGKSDKFEPITSQDELNRRLGERLQRERQKFADYDDLKAKAEAHDKALEAAMTDAEKAIAAARKDGESAATTAANHRLVAAEARALAAESGFRIGAASVVRLIDLSDVKVDDNGDVDTAAIKTKLDELKTNEPDLAGETKKSPPKPDRSQGGGGGTDSPSVNRGREMYETRRGAKKTA